MTRLLEISGISKRFGGLQAVKNFSAALNAGEIVGLIGPNGAGKTTLVNLVSGVLRPDRGEISLASARIDRLRPDQIARLGVARTFQIVQPFPRMTVLGNVAASALFAGGAASQDEARAEAARHLEFCGLAREADKIASSLTLAGRKRLELAKSLAAKPKLLMLDEVNAGLNSAEIDDALKLIRAIGERGVTILLIEHLMKVVSRACTRVLVLHQGELVADGATAAVMRDPRVIEAYLGSRYAGRRPATGS
jgi:branched-chain amino acid transport system ATP-binding protein